MKEHIKIVSISDTHGRLKFTSIPKCDVVTISGDFSALRNDRQIAYNGPLCKWIVSKFIPWLVSLPCERVIFIPGNHDFITEEPWFEQWFYEKLHAFDEYYIDAKDNPCKPSEKIVYLCEQTYIYKGWTFYGCPYSDIHGWAWSAQDNYKKYFVPEGVDVMLVHQAPDWMELGTSTFEHGLKRNFGSSMLMNALHRWSERLPKLLLCGHIHSGNHLPIIYDIWDDDDMKHSIMMANVSIKNETYTEFYHPRVFEMSEDEDGVVINTCAESSKDTSPVETFRI